MVSRLNMGVYCNSEKKLVKFLQVGRLYRALILLGLALCPSTSVFGLFLCFHPSLYFLMS